VSAYDDPFTRRDEGIRTARRTLVEQLRNA
jgi:hypothetical protein